MQIDFNYVGCYRSNKSNRSEFSIEIGAQAPYLRDHLVPDTLNVVKRLEPHEILDLTPRERYSDDGAGEKMETILQFIEQMDSNETILKKRIGSEFVCNRGLLVKLAMDKYKKFFAVKRKDVIFMCVESRDFLGYDKNAHMSMKFEKLITDDPFYMIQTNNMRLIRTGIRTKVVNRIKFPNLTVLSSAEVDCRDHNGNIVELKMTKKCREEHLRNRQNNPNLKEFLQSYLSNTEYILTGYSKQKEGSRLEIDELDMIHRDSLIGDFREVEEAIQNLSDTLLELKTLLSENNTAIMVNGVNNYGLKYKYINADDCQIVPQDFLNKYD